MIVVIGDPSKNGAEQFLDEPGLGYLESCSCAIQNMLLAAHAQGFGSLWYSLFEKEDVRKIFDIPEEKDPLGLICIGYPERTGSAPRRESFEFFAHFLAKNANLGYTYSEHTFVLVVI